MAFDKPSSRGKFHPYINLSPSGLFCFFLILSSFPCKCQFSSLGKGNEKAQRLVLLPAKPPIKLKKQKTPLKVKIEEAVNANELAWAIRMKILTCLWYICLNVNVHWLSKSLHAGCQIHGFTQFKVIDDCKFGTHRQSEYKDLHKRKQNFAFKIM